MNEDNNQKWGDDILLETKDILSTMMSHEETWITSEWTESDIDNKLFLLEEFNIEEIEADSLWRLSAKLGKFGKKLDLSGGASTISTLRHTYGLLKLCKALITRGCKINLIESCDPKGTQHVPDVDLVYSDGTGRYHVDYTHSGSLRIGMIKIFDREEKLSKYRDAEQFCLEGCTPRVMAYGINFILRKIKFNVFRGSPREKDFQFADSVIKNIQSLTIAEAETLLVHYANSVKSDNRSEMVQRPGFYGNQLELEDYKSIIHDNSESTAVKYIEMKNYMQKNCENDKNKEFFMNKYYSYKFFDQLSQQETKWHIPFPVIKRGVTSASVFDRLGEIVGECKRLGIVPSPLTIMLSMLSEHNEVNVEMLKDFCPSDCTYLSGVIVSRVYRKQELLGAVKMSFIKGESLKTLKEKIKRMSKSDHTVRDYVNLESIFKDFVDKDSEASTGSYMIEDIDNMIDDVGQDGPLSEFTRRSMRFAFDTISSTKTGTRLSQIQEVTYALLNGPRKRLAVHSQTGRFDSDSIILGLDTISDRYGVVMYNLGPLTFGELKDVSYMVHGVFEPEHDNAFVKRTMSSHTNVLGMSPAQMDWNTCVFHKAVSWCALSYETALVSCPDRLVELKKECMLPLNLAFLNSNKFSQVADQTRYLFVNGIGMTSGPAPLIDKISWYKAKTNLEKLYIMRLLKMSDGLSLHKALNRTSSLLTKQQITISEEGSLDMKVTIKGWKIAMPDEQTYSLSQQHTFNSFYNSRALSIQRYNKIVSEALVIEKQLDAREEYLEIKRMNYEHEGRNRKLITNKEDLKELILSTDFSGSEAKPYSPDPIVITLAFLSTMVALAHNKEITVGRLTKSIYNVDGVMRSMDVASVMNNRGSVISSGTNGVVRTNKELLTVNERGKKVTKSVLRHQNSKCYRTVILGLQDMVKNKLPPKSVSYDSIQVEDAKEMDQDLDLKEISELPDKLAPLVLYYSENHAACVSKMVHKDQLGSREIAVLNAASRIMCKYVEDVARHVRDSDISKGLRTNLIEISDKRDIVLNTVNKYNALKKSGYLVCFDSADCSKFGPTQMPHSLYLTLGLRGCTGNIDTLRNCLSLFSNKVFKIPDATYLMKKPEGDNVVCKSYERLVNMSKELGSWEKQLIFLEESMHQGILGGSSSVSAADAQHLANFCCEYDKRDICLKITSHLTSDDYSRAIAWKRDRSEHLYEVIKDSLSMHNTILTQCGIKRNLQKSTISRDYCEFNSEFFTSMGEIRPDIKSRISYVDVSPDPDPSPVAYRCMTQSTEYLRAEGSYVGACWVFLLNNCLAMYQNQSRRLWKSVGNQIYKLPLELGGLVKPDVLLCSVTHSHAGLLSNYCSEEGEPLQVTFANMMEHQSYRPELIDIDETGTQKLKIPSLSRSGTVHLCKRTPRQVRAIREFLMTCDKIHYRDVYNSRFGSSIVLALMACAQRESVDPKEEGSAFRFMVTQTSRRAKLYFINSPYLRRLTQESKITRDELHELAKKFLQFRHCHAMTTDCPLETQMIKDGIDAVSHLYQKLKVSIVSCMPRITHYHTHRETYVSNTYVQDRLDEYELMYLPTNLGGASDLHPWTYLEGRMTYTNFLRKFTSRRQLFRLSLREVDLSNNFPELILKSNFMAGGRLSYYYDPESRPKKPVDTTLNNVLSAMKSETKWNESGIVVDLLSSELPLLLSMNRVKKVNITGLMNAIIGDSEYIIRSQTLQNLILSELQANTVWKSKLVVDPLQLACSFPQMSYISSQNIKIWQRPLLGSNGPSGRELIVLAGGRFNHHITESKFQVIVPEDTDRDQYQVSSIFEHNWVNVRLSDTFGYTVLEEYMSHHLLQVLTSTNLKKNRIRFYVKNPIYEDDYFMEALLESQTKDLINNHMVEVYEVTENLREDDEFSNESNDTVDDMITRILEDDSDSDSDFDFEAGMMAALAAAGLEDKEQDVSAMLTSNALDDIKGMFEGGDEEDDQEEYSAPVSSQGSIRQPRVRLIDMARSAVDYIPQKAVSAAGRYFKTRFCQGYSLDLPATLNADVYTDANGKSAFECLFEELDQLPENDKIWLKSYIMGSFLNFGPVYQSVQTWRKRKDSVGDLEDANEFGF